MPLLCTLPPPLFFHSSPPSVLQAQPLPANAPLAPAPFAHKSHLQTCRQAGNGSKLGSSATLSQISLAAYQCRQLPPPLPLPRWPAYDLPHTLAPLLCCAALAASCIHAHLLILRAPCPCYSSAGLFARGIPDLFACAPSVNFRSTSCNVTGQGWLYVEACLLCRGVHAGSMAEQAEAAAGTQVLPQQRTRLMCASWAAGRRDRSRSSSAAPSCARAAAHAAHVAGDQGRAPPVCGYRRLLQHGCTPGQLAAETTGGGPCWLAEEHHPCAGQPLAAPIVDARQPGQGASAGRQAHHWGAGRATGVGRHDQQSSAGWGRVADVTRCGCLPATLTHSSELFPRWLTWGVAGAGVQHPAEARQQGAAQQIRQPAAVAGCVAQEGVQALLHWAVRLRAGGEASARGACSRRY